MEVQDLDHSNKIEKIKSVSIRKNLLHLDFEEKQGVYILEKIIQYTKFTEKLYYYVMFGYSFHNYDLSQYNDEYPILKENVGFFELREEDIDNYKFIYRILNQYHNCELYINIQSGLVEKYRNTDWREIPVEDVKSKGYTVNMLVDYIEIEKASDLPDWDLSKMGIKA